MISYDDSIWMKVLQPNFLFPGFFGRKKEEEDKKTPPCTSSGIVWGSQHIRIGRIRFSGRPGQLDFIDSSLKSVCLYCLPLNYKSHNLMVCHVIAWPLDRGCRDAA